MTVAHISKRVLILQRESDSVAHINKVVIVQREQ
jgi:hypothetical protein